MSTHTSGGQITSEARACVEALVSVLTERGLEARALRGGIIRAENHAARPDKDDRMARALYPGLRQEIACAPLDGRGPLWWYWVWSGRTRDASDEWEPLLPVSDLTAVADRIAAVLALRPDGEW
jgi:hypothetical protein